MANIFNLDKLLEILSQHKLLNSMQVREIKTKESVQRQKLLRQRQTHAPQVRFSLDEITPAELVSSLNLPTPKGDLTEDLIMEAIAGHAKLPFIKIDPLQLDMRLITETISRPFARRHAVLPLSKTGNKLRVATDNPYDFVLIENLKSHTGCEIDVVLASRSDILKIIMDVYGFQSSVIAAEADILKGTDLQNLEQFVKLGPAQEIDASDKHIVRAVEHLLRYAFEQRASDIHIEPKREISQVRFRIDGVLHSIHTMPKVVHAAVVSRIKMLSRLDIAEKRRPQDGRIKTQHEEREIELRISTLPVAFGEKVVIRIFDPDVLLQDLESLGMFPEELDIYKSFLARPNGVILVTGPTGSGKTTTLYSSLEALATPEVNITTIEDPIEMIVEKFNQTAVNYKIQLTFAGILRTLLRQDPDIIMVGEIRDNETADQAFQAALTGHLVLSTLHTNDTATSVTRLIELAVEPYLIASTLVGVVAQRLVRKVCDQCVETVDLTREQQSFLSIHVPEGVDKTLKVKRGKGCVTCRGTGLYGRSGIFEVMPVSERIRKLIMKRSDSKEILKAAQTDGMKTLRESAIRKLALGVTSYDEVIRVTTES